MGEKWFEFVKRIKKEGNHASLKDAMRDASKRKSEWRKDGPSEGDAKPASKRKTMKKGKSRKGKKGSKSRKSRKSRKGKKGGEPV